MLTVEDRAAIQGIPGFGEGVYGLLVVWIGGGGEEMVLGKSCGGGIGR